MKYRPEQVFGFKLVRIDATGIVISGLDDYDETVSGVFESFCAALERDGGDLAREAMKQVRKGDVGVASDQQTVRIEEKGLCEPVKEDTAAFSFGFFNEGENSEEAVD